MAADSSFRKVTLSLIVHKRDVAQVEQDLQEALDLIEMETSIHRDAITIVPTARPKERG